MQAQLASPDPEEAVRGLAWLRSLAFSSGDFGLLDQVNVPASAAAAADGRISARLKESGRVLAGFTTLLTRVEDAPRRDGGPSRAVVAVTAATSAYQERDATGAVLADAAAAPEQQLRLVLAPVEGRWRIQDILPGRRSPRRRSPAAPELPAAASAPAPRRGNRPPGPQDFGPRSATQAAACGERRVLPLEAGLAQDGRFHPLAGEQQLIGELAHHQAQHRRGDAEHRRPVQGAGQRAISEFTSALSGAQRFTGPGQRAVEQETRRRRRHRAA